MITTSRSDDQSITPAVSGKCLEASTERLIAFKQDLRWALGNLTDYATLRFGVQLSAYKSIGRTTIFLWHWCVPTDDKEILGLMAGIAEKCSLIMERLAELEEMKEVGLMNREKKFSDEVLYRRNVDPLDQIENIYLVSLWTKKIVFLYSNPFNKTAVAHFYDTNEGKTPRRVFCFNIVDEMDRYLWKELNLTFFDFRNEHDYIMGTALLSAIQMQLYSDVVGGLDTWEEDLKQGVPKTQNAIEALIHHHYKVSRRRQAARPTRALVDEELKMASGDGVLGLETLRWRLDSVISTKFNDPKESYGIFVWPRQGCPLVSQHIALSNSTSFIRLSTGKDVNFLVHRTRLTNESLSVFEAIKEKRADFSTVIDIETAGRIIVEVDPLSATRIAANFKEMDLLAVLVFEKPEDVHKCATLTGFAHLRAERKKNVGFPLFYKDKNYVIYVLFGI
ncbi:hypothetical protein QR680_008020 [Steinernema hermaphroditum]|uniref:Uncharacterized protein n=1 Tax=Steinernema hermaphroditum TaxID=289476 RepID=A0AA39M6W9_9BILA|nr:hypothetical protein QR680_008020 [Steinernema hermaphroditum]